MLPFRPVSLSDCEAVRAAVEPTECRNCDLNVVNLMSWRFLYDTELAFHEGWLLFRFKSDGHLAYLAPVGSGDLRAVVRLLVEDAAQQGHPFLMLGVPQERLNALQAVVGEHIYATAAATYSDYIYSRESLQTLAGKRLQPKRNHLNKFRRLYPNCEYLPLTADALPECRELYRRWQQGKTEEGGRLQVDWERRSVEYVFDHWDALGATGGMLRVDGQIVAWTYGAPINHDTFDVCAEKADLAFDGAFTAINQAFVAHLPEQYTLINREEDLGIEGLRRAKESYHPLQKLQKFAVMLKHPLGPSAADAVEL